MKFHGDKTEVIIFYVDLPESELTRLSNSQSNISQGSSERLSSVSTRPQPGTCRFRKRPSNKSATNLSKPHYRHLMTESVSKEESDSDLTSETEQQLLKVLLRNKQETAEDEVHGSNRTSLVEQENDAEEDSEPVFHLDEELRHQIEDIDNELNQVDNTNQVSPEEAAVSESDSDVELLDNATRRYLNKVQHKRPKRRQRLGFYLRKLKNLEYQIQNIMSEKDIIKPLSEQDWKYLLSESTNEERAVERGGEESKSQYENEDHDEEEWEEHEESKGKEDNGNEADIQTLEYHDLYKNDKVNEFLDDKDDVNVCKKPT
uniref:Uncharacterized protein n=1 Tax=Cacopsylla melanoneura TaxID=428564 RepID=A0A8D8LXP9_9HEMI